MQRSPPAEPADERLVALAQDGNREAFEVLVERYKQRAYRIAYDFTRHREDAKDLSQEAFLRAFANIRGFDSQASFYTWFYRILVNLCLDYRRRLGRVSWRSLEEAREQPAEASVMPGDSLPHQEVIASEMSRKVGQALEALPPKQRAAFLLRNHEGLSIREIAGIMRTAEGTVKVHLHRAVAALRQSLAGFV
jgi:RNA polymerase sigma-70 factor (ECF subfamily)